MSQIKVNEYHKRLVEGVTKVLESKEFNEFLCFSTKFRNYSFNNTLLIWAQRCGATHVAGMKTWNSFGRRVKKGEKGIAIFAPLIRKGKEREAQALTHESTSKENLSEVAGRLIGFKAVYVWDIDQTEGKPVPELKTEAPVMDGDPEGLFDRILLASPVPVEYEDIKRGANGYYMPKEQRIVLDSKLTAEQRAKTLLHELAHHLAINSSDEKESEKHDRPTGEVIAEGAAFIAAAHFKLDSSGYSFPYVASWSQDAEKVLKAGEAIRKVGLQLIGMVEEVKTKELPAMTGHL
jgi:hypothetical protein